MNLLDNNAYDLILNKGFHSTLLNCQAFYTGIALWLQMLRFLLVLLMVLYVETICNGNCIACYSF